MAEKTCDLLKNGGGTDKVKEYTVTGYGAAQGQTSTIYRYGKICVLTLNVPISRFPTSSDTPTGMDAGYIIGTFAPELAPKEITFADVQTNIAGEYKGGAQAYMRQKGDLSAGSIGVRCTGTYANNMVIRGQVIWTVAD